MLFLEEFPVKKEDNATIAETLKRIFKDQVIRQELKEKVKEILAKVDKFNFEEALIELGFTELPYDLKAIIFKKFSLDVKRFIELLYQKEGDIL